MDALIRILIAHVLTSVQALSLCTKMSCTEDTYGARCAIFCSSIAVDPFDCGSWFLVIHAVWLHVHPLSATIASVYSTVLALPVVLLCIRGVVGSCLLSSSHSYVQWSLHPLFLSPSSHFTLVVCGVLVVPSVLYAIVKTHIHPAAGPASSGGGVPDRSL